MLNVPKHIRLCECVDKSCMYSNCLIFRSFAGKHSRPQTHDRDDNDSRAARVRLLALTRSLSLFPFGRKLFFSCKCFGDRLQAIVCPSVPMRMGWCACARPANYYIIMCVKQFAVADREARRGEARRDEKPSSNSNGKS